MGYSQNVLISPPGLEVVVRILHQANFSDPLVQLMKGIHYQERSKIGPWVEMDQQVTINSKTALWHREDISLKSGFQNWTSQYPYLEINPVQPFANGCHLI